VLLPRPSGLLAISLALLGALALAGPAAAADPDLSVDKSHSGDFFQNQTGALYTVAVTNHGGGPTTSPITVDDTLPSDLSATSASGAQWTCGITGNGHNVSCTYSDPIPAGLDASPLQITVDVSASAQSTVTNTATVSGGGEPLPVVGDNNDSDPTTIRPGPDLVVAKSHTGDFFQTENGAQYRLVVTNPGGGPISGAVTVADQLPVAWLRATAIAGTGWSCTLGTLSCTRADGLAPGSSYAPVLVTVDVATDAPSQLVNGATVAGGNEVNTGNDSASDPTVVAPAGAVLTLVKSHAGDLIAGQSGATYTIVTSNQGETVTYGAVTVRDVLPAGLAARAISGEGWNCDLVTLACTRSDALGPGLAYPPISVTVDVAPDAPRLVVNRATVTGGASRNASVGDPTTIVRFAAISGLAVSPASFRAARSGPSVKATRAKTGAMVSFTLSRAADVNFTVLRLRRGVRRGGRCIVASTARRPCTVAMPVHGKFTVAGAEGRKRFRFTGRLGGRSLASGRYQLVAIPLAGGRPGPPARAPFRIK
jgi:uncharacterized repeat protein (TIGR01451 family)